jgi:hypothetical protein
MDPMQIFWLFFMLAALQPAITQRLLEASRKRLIGQIEGAEVARCSSCAPAGDNEPTRFSGFPLH